MSDATNVDFQPSSSENKTAKTFKIIGLVFLFFSCLIVFTLAKLPEAKTTALMQGYLQSALDPYGVYITDQGREFSIWRGFTYKLIHPTIELSDQTRIEMDEISASPKLLSFLMAKPGVKIELIQGGSVITLNGSGRGDKIDADIKLSQVNIGKLELLSYFAQIKGSGLITGEFKVNGSLSDLSTLNGEGAFQLKSIQIEEQLVMGFQLPAMKIAEGVIDFTIVGGKVQIKTVQLGKPTDDLNLQMTGDIALKSNLNSSIFNTRIVFGFSDKVKQSLGMLDAILTNAKQSDNRYAYKLTGALGNAPIPDPK